MFTWKRYDQWFGLGSFMAEEEGVEDTPVFVFAECGGTYGYFIDLRFEKYDVPGFTDLETCKADAEARYRKVAGNVNPGDGKIKLFTTEGDTYEYLREY